MKHQAPFRRKRLMLAALAPVILALQGCATTPAATVLRFHQDAPIARGAILVAPLPPQTAESLEFRAEAAPVAAELQRLGYVLADNAAGASFRALVGITTSERQGAPRRSGLSIGLGGGFSSGNVGIGSGVQVPVTGKTTASTETTTTLTVRIVRSPGDEALWEGRASLDTGDKGERGAALSPLLAPLLFRNFPGPSGTTETIPIR